MSLERFRQESERWLAQARADLKAAEASAAAGSYEWACFQSQQAAEKALKAFWLFHAADPWGHSLVRLIQDYPDDTLRAELMPFLRHAKQLDKLYIPTRYPNGLPDMIPADVFTDEDAVSAIATAREVIDGIAAKLS